jgi:hypothetical protein
VHFHCCVIDGVFVAGADGQVQFTEAFVLTPVGLPIRSLEEMAGLVVVGLAILVHVPQAAVVCLPRVERARRFQDRAVALDCLDLGCDGGDDPVTDLVEDEERVVQLVVEGLGPDDPGAARLGQLDGDGEALALRPDGSADDVVDVEGPAGFLRADAPLVQREHCPLRDDEEAPQLGEPGDHIVGDDRSYDWMWLAGITLCLFAAVVRLPIREGRLVPAAALA